MTDLATSFRALYSQAIPADLDEITLFESMVREGVLTRQLGDVDFITNAITTLRLLDTGIENALVFMWVHQPRHVDYYCFHRPEEASQNSVPVILVADKTIVQTWPDFGAFLAWEVGP